MTNLAQFSPSPSHGNQRRAGSNLIFDPEGNLYGATVYGGANDEGAVFELTPVGGA